MPPPKNPCTVEEMDAAFLKDLRELIATGANSQKGSLTATLTEKYGWVNKGVRNSCFRNLEHRGEIQCPMATDGTGPHVVIPSIGEGEGGELKQLVDKLFNDIARILSSEPLNPDVNKRSIVFQKLKEGLGWESREQRERCFQILEQQGRIESFKYSAEQDPYFNIRVRIPQTAKPASMPAASAPPPPIGSSFKSVQSPLYQQMPVNPPSRFVHLSSGAAAGGGSSSTTSSSPLASTNNNNSSSGLSGPMHVSGGERQVPVNNVTTATATTTARPGRTTSSRVEVQNRPRFSSANRGRSSSANPSPVADDEEDLKGNFKAIELMKQLRKEFTNSEIIPSKCAKIFFDRSIGDGGNGICLEAQIKKYSNRKIRCVAKVAKPGKKKYQENLMAEAKSFIGLRHENIVSFLGVSIYVPEDSDDEQEEEETEENEEEEEEEEDFIINDDNNPQPNPRLCIFLEKAPCDLRKFLNSAGSKQMSLPEEIIYELAIQIAYGLAYLHAPIVSKSMRSSSKSKNRSSPHFKIDQYNEKQKILHLDLKPENVLLFTTNHRLTAKLCDFGSVKVTDHTETNLSRPRAHTSGYVPPEFYIPELASLIDQKEMMDGSPQQQQNAKKRVSTRFDVFSFGAILYEMITGQKCKVDLDKIKKSRDFSGCVVDVQTIKSMMNPQITRDSPISRICAQCLSINPTDRPKDGSELYELLCAESPAIRQRKQFLESTIGAVSSSSAAKTSRSGLKLQHGYDPLLSGVRSISGTSVSSTANSLYLRGADVPEDDLDQEIDDD
jgi:serine/threonine protein kinase